jgi:hypothetical protein
MANPQYPVNIAAGAWVKVATNVTTGVIHKMLKGTYFQTYRLTGEDAPITKDEAVKVFMDKPLTEDILSSVGIDVYIWNDVVGIIRVDV